MIKINLAQDKKTTKTPIFLGLDISQVNLKAILIILALSFVPDILMKSDWDKELQALDGANDALSASIKKLEKESSSFVDVQKQIDLLGEKEKQLMVKLEVVKKIIKIKRNPMKVLLYIAKNIPENLWLTSLVFENDLVTIQGNSSSYRSIGLFVENLKSSVFFGRNPQLSGSKAVTDTTTGQTYEQFEIKAKVVRFE
ncbi:MAG: PilN domain-containing protein [Bacteriovoracaceae bacterium]|nr:PilN domain-containing protein [Bacteriovoracaceae bacterium]